MIVLSTVPLDGSSYKHLVCAVVGNSQVPFAVEREAVGVIELGELGIGNLTEWRLSRGIE